MADVMAPVVARDRIDAIDILRGVALFGIITANMRGFVAPRGVYFNPDVLWPSGINYAAQVFEFLFVQGKFITLFSILFGLGFAVQIMRARERGKSIAFYPRRLAILAVFGMLHWWLIWWGDILWEYAGLGFILLLFRNRSQKFLASSASVALALAVLMPLGFYSWTRLHPQPATVKTQQEGNKPGVIPPPIQKDIALYGSLKYPEIVRSQFNDWVHSQRFLPFLYIHLLSRFLFGFWLWRTGFFKNLAAYSSQLRFVRLWGMIAGVTATLVIVLIEALHLPPGKGPSLFGALEGTFSILAAPLLALFYGACILLGTLSGKWRPRLAPFAAVGRMALTNYVMQSLVLTWSFRLTGLYGGVIGPFALPFIGAGFFAAQVWFSNWWLSQYQFGPLEWLWRSLTYGQFQPMRRGEEEGPQVATAIA